MDVWADVLDTFGDDDVVPSKHDLSLIQTELALQDRARRLSSVDDREISATAGSSVGVDEDQQVVMAVTRKVPEPRPKTFCALTELAPPQGPHRLPGIALAPLRFVRPQRQSELPVRRLVAETALPLDENLVRAWIPRVHQLRVGGDGLAEDEIVSVAASCKRPRQSGRMDRRRRRPHVPGHSARLKDFARNRARPLVADQFRIQGGAGRDTRDECNSEEEPGPRVHSSSITAR